MTDFIRRHYKKAIVCILLMHVITHLPFLHLPPCSIHVWRQCNTLAVARNFYEENNTITQPRVDRRYDSDGVTGMQFPAYEWGLAQIYRLTGEHYFVQRSYALVISSIAILCTFLFFYKYRGDPLLGVLAAWFLTWSPEWYYHSINALPDILAFAAGTGALAAYGEWTQRKTTGRFTLTILLLAMAGLVKIQYGIFGGIIAALLVHQYRRNVISKKHFFHWTIGGGVAIAIVSGWYVYANQLIKSSGLYDYVLNIRPITNLPDALAIVKRNLISDLPELLFNYAGTMLVLIGLFNYIRPDNRKKWVAIPAFILFILWYVVMLEQMKVHQYYMLPLLILAVFPVLNGIKWLLEGKRKIALWLLIIAMPVLAMIRILPARWMKEDLGIPSAFADQRQLEQLIKAVPDHQPIITLPDESGCIWLYFLHKKGFSYADEGLFTTFNNKGELLFDEYKRRGAKWLYTPTDFFSGRGLEVPASLQLSGEIGGITIYSITPP